MQSPFHEDFNRIAAWSPALQDPLSGLNGAYVFGGKCAGARDKPTSGKIDWKDFGPRIGFAWQPMNKWTIRGAYGIFYSPDTQEDFGLPTPTFAMGRHLQPGRESD